MNLYLVYGSTDGQTQRIASFLRDRLRSLGHQVTASDAARLPVRFRLPHADAYIVAASVHLGRYQRSIRRVVANDLRTLNANPSMFLSVSLAVMGDAEDQAGLKACVDRFIRKTGWMPARIAHAAGAIRYRRYGWLKRLLMRRVARAKGASIDTSRNHEFTDWEALGRLADEFVAALAAQERPRDEGLPDRAAAAALAASPPP